MGTVKRDYDEIVRLYNTEGSAVAKRFIRDSYSVKTPEYMLHKLKSSNGYTYDEVTKKYVASLQEESESLFIGLENLCQKQGIRKESKRELVICSQSQPKPSINELFYSLMQDKLTEISKFISLEQSHSCVSINVTALKAAGYRVSLD